MTGATRPVPAIWWRGLPARAVAGVTAAMLGLVILYGVGFAGSSALHGAAHDTRHAFTFPCH